jgi:hypothetical protein
MSNRCHLCQSLLFKFAYLSSQLPVDLPSTHVPVTLCLSSPSAYRHLTFCMLLPSTYVPVILCLFLSDMHLTLHESAFIWLTWIWICIWNHRNFLKFYLQYNLASCLSKRLWYLHMYVYWPITSFKYNFCKIKLFVTFKSDQDPDPLGSALW